MIRLLLLRTDPITVDTHAPTTVGILHPMSWILTVLTYTTSTSVDLTAVIQAQACFLKCIIDAQRHHQKKLISQEYYTGDSTSSPKQKHYGVANIIEWVQCFGIYTAIISKKEPDWTADLIGYQQMIIDSSQNCCEGDWLNYDQHFRLKASATGLKDWSSVEMNIWKRAFPDRVKQLSPQYTPSYTRQGPQHYSANYSQPREQNICLEWNDSPNPNCLYPDCKFEHRCYRCVFNSESRHKALFCPNMNKK